MEIISYVKWTEEGERERFYNLIPLSKNTEELKQNIMKEFDVDKTTANTIILRYREKIKQLQKA